MIRGLYSAAGGMQATSQQQDTISHNLAHAVKPGYLREIVRFEASGDAEGLQAPVTSQHTDFSPGTMQFTGNRFDLALNGPGFFSIQGQNGPVYTRNGTFQMNATGQLVTMEGLPVMGIGGPIEIPVAAASVHVQPNGNVIADGAEIDQIRVVAFQNPNELQRAGSTYFQAPPNAAVAPAAPEILQGSKEISNSTLVQEMVQMIAGVRHFEAAQRALRTISDAVANNTHPLSS